jgi:SAM-dependent methyltransferase
MNSRSNAVEQRAASTLGTSGSALYGRAREILRQRGARGHAADVGCGRGVLHSVLAGIATTYCGIDVMRYEGFPAHLDFYPADLDRDALPLPDASADIVVALEVIEHLENPRRFMREIVRVTRPGGTVLLSTPNQVSALSLLTLLARGQFNAFQQGGYPAHLTALLPVDLRRIAEECGLVEIQVLYSHEGRVPLTSRRFPCWTSRRFPRFLSDNVFVTGQVPLQPR